MGSGGSGAGSRKVERGSGGSGRLGNGSVVRGGNKKPGVKGWAFELRVVDAVVVDVVVFFFSFLSGRACQDHLTG